MRMTMTMTMRVRCRTTRWTVFWVLLLVVACSNAFLTPPHTSRTRRIGNSNSPAPKNKGSRGDYNDGASGGGSHHFPPPPWSSSNSKQSASDEHPQVEVSSSWKPEDQNETESSSSNNSSVVGVVEDVRGGGAASQRDNKRKKQRKNDNNVARGAQATLASTSSYWKDAFHSVSEKVTMPVKSAASKVTSLFQSKKQKQQALLMQQLQTMPVRHVTVPNSTVLPTEVIQLAAKRAGVLGSPLRMDRVSDFAQTLQRWYQRKGYVLHSVTGATLLPESATAEIAVQEPLTAGTPVEILFCKEMVVDSETGELLTLREYKDKHEKRRSFGFEKMIQKQNLNTTYVATDKGRTNPQRLAGALGLQPGQPFQWDAAKWRHVVASGIFAKVLRAGPKPMGDGTVRFDIVATEPPARHLEYGLGKSLYTGSWEGELDFQHGNLLGGGETIGINVRRRGVVTKGGGNAFPSVRVSYTDDKFGMAGGYDVQVFTENLDGGGGGGETETKITKKKKEKEDEGTISTSKDKDSEATTASSPNTVSFADADDPAKAMKAEATTASSPNALSFADAYDDPDPVLTRRGLSFRIKNPITQRMMRNSVASASIERTTTTAGVHENIASTSVTVGPFVRELPFDARSNVDFTVTTGTRVGLLTEESHSEKEEKEGEAGGGFSSWLSSRKLLPYSSLTATTKQIFPLITIQGADSSTGKRPVVLALRHSLTTSTNSLPRHEAKAQGLAANIRGSSCNGPVSSSLRGTTELRVPVNIPILKNLRQDGNIVVFGDWLVADGAQETSSLFRKSSFGVGLRKSVQGIPLQMDVTYSKEMKLKTSFGLGRDFDV